MGRRRGSSAAESAAQACSHSQLSTTSLWRSRGRAHPLQSLLRCRFALRPRSAGRGAVLTGGCIVTFLPCSMTQGLRPQSLACWHAVGCMQCQAVPAAAGSPIQLPAAGPLMTRCGAVRSRCRGAETAYLIFAAAEVQAVAVPAELVQGCLGHCLLLAAAWAGCWAQRLLWLPVPLGHASLLAQLWAGCQVGCRLGLQQAVRRGREALAWTCWQSVQGAQSVPGWGRGTETLRLLASGQDPEWCQR